MPRLLPISVALTLLLGALFGCKGGEKSGNETGIPGGSEDTGPLGAPVDLVAAINPKIATGGIGYQVGCGYPGATQPFGLVKLSPDTAGSGGAAFGAYRGGGYHADDIYIQTFSHLHLYAVGLTDYGLLGVMPTDGIYDAEGNPRTTEDTYRALFDKESETAVAGRYDVRFLEMDIEASLAATPHTGLHRYRFGPGVAEPTLLIDLGHLMDGAVLLEGSLETDPATGRIRGKMRHDGAMAAPFSTWFEMQVEPLPDGWGTWSDPATLAPESTSFDVVATEGPIRTGAWLSWERLEGGTREVHLRVAVSTADAEGAAANFTAEHDGFDLEATVEAAQEAWATQLGPVRIWGGTADQQQIFATALYHSAQMPTLFADTDGRYRGFDDQVHQGITGIEAEDFLYHTDLSLWDTYRTTHPLYTLLWPDQHRHFLRSLVKMDEQGGALPKWPIATWDGGFMVGTPADIVLAEALVKGLVVEGAPASLGRAAEVALGSRSTPYAGRGDAIAYGSLAWYAAETGDASVSRTQEVSVADHAMALAGRRLGPEGSGLSEDVTSILEEHAGFWANHYNPATGYMEARNADGSFVPLRNPGVWDDAYAEGNARQYRFMAPHDPEGLAQVLGGEATALTHLRELFEEAVPAAEDDVHGIPEPWYWHGNEVDLHAAWLFALWGSPDETRRWVNWIQDTWYGTGPDGLAGNDDAGTLSAWYVWSAMGLYPLAGTDRYVIGLPLFQRMEIDRGNGRTLVISREGAQGTFGENQEVRVLIDETLTTSPEISHEALMSAENLRFVVLNR